MRILAGLMFCMVVASGAPGAAGPVRYDFTGVADAGGINIYTFDFATQDFVEGAIIAPAAGLAIAGSFTLIPANLPAMEPSDFHFAYYNVSEASPPFLSSTSAASYNGVALGVATTGSYYSQIQFGGFDPNYAGTFADYGGDYFGDPVVEYHDNGSIRSRTSFYQYNSLFFVTGPGVNVDERLVPGPGREARFAIESYFVQELFSEDQRGISNRIAFWQVAGNGLVTVSGMGGVPEPASWALMIFGLGLVGGAMRTANRVTPTGAARFG